MNKKKWEKQAEETNNELFRILGQGIQISVMDLGKVLQPSKDILLSGGTTEEAALAMKKALDQYQVKK